MRELTNSPFKASRGGGGISKGFINVMRKILRARGEGEARGGAKQEIYVKQFKPSFFINPLKI